MFSPKELHFTMSRSSEVQSYTITEEVIQHKMWT